MADYYFKYNLKADGDFHEEYVDVEELYQQFKFSRACLVGSDISQTHL